MVVQQFIAYLAHQRRCSPHTLQAYQRDLGQLQAFLQSHEAALETATHQHLRHWVATMHQAGLGPSTIGRKLASARSCWAWALQQGLLQHNPTLLVRSPKRPKRLPQHLTLRQTTALVAPPEGSSENTLHQLVVQLLYATGMRRAELIGLQVSDYDPGTHTLRVLGKRSKQRLVPLLPQVATLLNTYLAERAAQLGHVPHLLCLPSGQPLYPMFVQRVVRQQAAAVGAHASPHTLRHTAATHLLQAGAGLTEIKELLGHSSLAATQVYTHSSQAHLQQAHQLLPHFKRKPD